ncbi:23S rRNA (adenine(2058)-N(6))-methyltransferase Erm(O) [Streptomyces coeruleorubidus]|uniref:23S rRNA (adenine(2058)-N(6))-methyltransferase Erm(O) n=1 Tax=Streptomyces coeruleorubidus TaxID=116188 RepID=UPI00237F74E3|nr:23S rRNA (adenine(2058)-N(6))-methyltransferase Erm(O) [Streptomyces coeruleorubidus]WDV55278.1 23S rRNA (adenine(2058)-N(6))-methyltransferase Erm(O) [Streptomyces coeruleorubidus]
MARPTATSRALSQNFLADRTTAERFARLAAPQARPIPLLLEVGAGKGALTTPLARRCRELHAYEIDPRLVPVLRSRFSGTPHVRVVGGDFLAAHPPRTPFSVAGNVPFSRTAAVVDWCLRAPALTDATLLTQLEYARKRTGDYGSWTLLTVRTWPRYEWRLLGRVGRRSFRPVPRVDAGVLRMERREAPLLDAAGYRSWRHLVELGFSGVGGSLHASLRRAHPRRRVDAAFRAARLDSGVLVGEVAPERWLRLHEELTC